MKLLKYLGIAAVSIVSFVIADVKLGWGLSGRIVEGADTVVDKISRKKEQNSEVADNVAENK